MVNVMTHYQPIEIVSASEYADRAMAYLECTENLGRMEDADQVTEVTGPCGDKMTIFLRITNNTLEDVKMDVDGCMGTVVSASALVSLAKGKTLAQAKTIDLDLLMKELERVPEQKAHCARLAVKTLHCSIEQYQSKNKFRNP